MIVHSYQTESGKDLILEYINSLSTEEQIDAFSVLECMEKGEFDRIVFKRWEKKIYEVYFKKHNRIFYVVVDKNNIYLLHACRKQKNRTEKRDKKIVIERAKEVGSILNRKFI